MNKILKMLIKAIIQNNIIIHTKTSVGDKYTIYNHNHNEILTVINGWATKQYSIAINKKTLLSVKWDETNSKPLTPEQKDILDIINTCKEKIDLQETAQTMNGEELQMANFLQQSLCEIKH